ncbi:glycosyltransferase family 4 protein [Halosimplex halophilum]|uniref:glycosyltransferase family 4 protein n=1 Tax=Halosimplex halophilum TaxID=2559572 RepID=UPI00107F3C10|nr:glycosyltransferase family 4 protein [Halosimplex halophilum]
MDIGYVSNVVYPFVTGGAEKRIHEIGRRLADRGHDVTVYGRHFWDGPAVRRHDGMTLRAVAPERDLYTDDRRSIAEAVDFAARATGPLVKRAGGHDVLVVSVFPYFPVFAGRLATATRTPLVTTWHEVWGEWWNEYLGRLAPFGRAVEYVAANVPQHAVAVSETTADDLARIGPDRDAITVVPNGIDFDHVRGVAPADEGTDLLFVGRLIADKNLDTLLRAFARVADRHDLSLAVVGDGPEREALGALADDLGVADRVEFRGFVEDHDDVLAAMRAATVFVSPSVREGFGITLVEAMAAGCRVVAADHPNVASAEVVGDAGHLVEPTVDGLVDGIETGLFGDPPATSPVERAGEFDWDRVATEALAAYRESAD